MLYIYVDRIIDIQSTVICTYFNRLNNDTTRKLILFLFRNLSTSAGDNQLSEEKEKNNIWDQSKIKNLSRKFNIDLAPKVIVFYVEFTLPVSSYEKYFILFVFIIAAAILSGIIS